MSSTLAIYSPCSTSTSRWRSTWSFSSSRSAARSSGSRWSLRSLPVSSGMLLGKFLPPHLGHKYMIDFARRCVDELTVFVCSIEREPIPGRLRYQWMRDHFGGVRVVHCEDENPQGPEED